MATIYFVTEDKLKKTTPVAKNVDMNEVIFNIRNIADMYIKSILGTYFYNDLLNKYNAQTMNTNELILLDYIQPAICWGATSESIVSVSYQLKNKGIQTQTGDFSANAEYKEVMFLVHHYADKRDFYLNNLKRYLLDNKGLFTSFDSDLNTDSIIKDCGNGGSLFTTGIIFI